MTVLFLWLLLAIAVVLVWQVWSRTRTSRPLFCPWGPEDVLIVTGAFLTSVVLLGTLARQMLPSDTGEWVASGVMGLCGVLIGALLLYYLDRRYGLRPRDVGLRFEWWGRDGAMAAGLLILVLFVRLPIVQLLRRLSERTGEPMETQIIVSQMLDVTSPLGLAVMAIVALVVAPVWEELVFRGFLQPFIRRYLGAGASIVITAVLFSMIHDPTSRFLAVPLMVFPLALALGYAYHRTQRLAAPIFLHVLHNLVSVVALLALRALQSAPVP